MDNEKFVFCELKNYKTKDGQERYYMNIYSSFERLERVFLTKPQLEKIVSLIQEKRLDINKIVKRTYNRYSQSFVLTLID